MKLFIKNMVCARCTLAVQNEANKLQLPVLSVSLGEVDFASKTLTSKQLELFSHNIKLLGFEIINDKKARLIENTKKQIINLIHQDYHQLEDQKIKLSDYLSAHLFKDYTYLSHLFSSVEGVTIEQYFIHQKAVRLEESRRDLNCEGVNPDIFLN